MPQRYKKTVLMMRAVSGSGKTTISKCIVNSFKSKELSVGIHSTDNYFMVDDKYVFDISKLAKFHNQNLINFETDLTNNLDIVICDNMNLLPWQSEEYTNLARRYNYKIVFVNFLPRELNKHLAAQIVTPEKPDAHNLSEDLLKRLIDDFHAYNGLLDLNNSIIVGQHYLYVWDEVKCERVKTEIPAKHFDSDYVLTIHPKEYKEIQVSIGHTLLNLIEIKEGDK